MDKTQRVPDTYNQDGTVKHWRLVKVEQVPDKAVVEHKPERKEALMTKYKE